MRRRRRKLPKIATKYIKSLFGYELRAARSVLRLFHNWLDARKMALTNLRPDDVDSFLAQPRGRPIADGTRNVYRYHIRIYLGWLYEQQCCEVDPRTLDKRSTRPALPNDAENFLAQLEPTTRPSTQLGHRHRLQRLHRWLDENGVAAEEITRHDIVRWAQYLHEQGLAPVTRLGILITVRMYLWYLADEGVLQEAPDSLIRRSDMPKLPKYLPRPLSPDVDHELRRRLEASSSPLQWGLLLMRNTGLRIGELRSLGYDCLRMDERGRRFIKVPLGKLQSERLVPIDHSTLEIIERLRATDTSNRTWLVQAVPDRQTSYYRLRRELSIACAGIDTPEPVTSHQLRHTYATTLINAGMSLTGLMHLLGHRDIRMTLRYAAVTLETVGREYFQALEVLEQRYRCNIHHPGDEIQLNAMQALGDIIRLIKRQTPTLDSTDQRRARLLIRRLERIHKDLAAFAPQPPSLPAP